MSAPFKPGDCVECIDAGPSEEGYTPPELIQGAHYTVFAVGEDPFGQPGVFLDEQDSRGFAGGYLAYRFRKIDDEVTEDFRARLRTLNPPEPVDASSPAGHLRAPVEHRARLSSQVRS